MNAALALLARDLRLALRQSGDWLMPLGFFLLVVTLFPLAITPEPKKLAVMAPGVIWVGALLAMLLSLDGLFRQDLEDGSLEQLLVAPAPLPALVLAKVVAHWLQTGFCLVLLAPVAAVMLFLDMQVLPVLVATLLLGTPVLSLTGAIAAALTVALRRGGVLVPLITLPLLVPVIVFATGAVQAAAAGMPVAGYLALLAAFLVLALTLVPFAVAAALRIAVGG
ncbi:MAG TPA: heme exporter protein CcmB [Moraxellaceae bacterium]|nr:heme exporter protein CcmB [Moraxellaceae bacterium]